MTERPSHTTSDWADRAYLDVGYIPEWRRVYDNGVEVWPGDGKIPEGWDGAYPDNSVIVPSRRSGRSKRR